MNWQFYQQQYSSFLHAQRMQGGLWMMWLIVMPLVPLIAYALLGFLKVLPSDGQIPKFLYIMIGMTLWLLLSDALMKPTGSIARYKSYFIRQEIGVLPLLTAWIPERLLALFLQTMLCLSLVIIETGLAVINLAGFLFILLLGYFLFQLAGFIVAVISLIYPNFNNFVTTINRFLLFVSGVIFPLPSGEITQYLQIVNPYYVFIDGARSALFGIPLDWPIVGAWVVFGLVLFCVLSRTLPKISPSLREFLQ